MVPYAAPSGESVVDVTVGDVPHDVTFPLVRHLETPTPLAPGDKVLLEWLGGDPLVVGRLVP